MTSKNKSRLLLVDGSAIMHRAYHALPSLTNRKGQSIGAVYGFIRMLLKAVKDVTPQYVVVAFDRREPTFRKELFIGYQAHRPPMEEELGDQFGTVQELLKELQVPVLDKAGFEADDIIGTIASQVVPQDQKSKIKNQNDRLKVKKKAKKSLKSRNSKFQIPNSANIDEVIVLSGDKDLMQLVNDRVKLYLPIKGVSETELVDPKGVKNKLGVHADQVIDYKALVGDPSDNYPGVYGVGPKTATDLLRKYQTFDGVYQHLDQIKGAVKDKLEKGKPGGELSRDLATIKTNMDLDFNLEASPILSDPQKLSQILANFGFKALAKQVLPEEDKPKQLTF
jgi:DNA polymerase-1